MNRLIAPMNITPARRKFLYATAFLALLATKGKVSAAVVTWDGSASDGLWDTGANWDSNSAPGTTDQVIIQNGDTVTRASSISLNDLTGTTNDGLDLRHGTLNITGGFTSTTNGGTSSSPDSNFGVSGGATVGTLTMTGTLTLGNLNASSGSSASFNIFTGSSVSANAFAGDHTSGTGVGGYSINVYGGGFNITNTFDWSDIASDGSANIGRIVIGSTTSAVGGTVMVGTMNNDWDDDGNRYVLFNDSLGSLTFGKTNWTNLADVQALIAGNSIRKDVSITNSFLITDTGTSWTVTIIPEPETALLGGLGVLLLLRRRRVG